MSEEQLSPQQKAALTRKQKAEQQAALAKELAGDTPAPAENTPAPAENTPAPAENTPAPAEVSKSLPDIVEVINISGKNLNMSKGCILAGKGGAITRAEYLCHSSKFELRG